jgi:organic hydroperoxide reductase OsmC/OhrA
MPCVHRAAAEHVEDVSELVWDAGLRGTATVASGPAIAVGQEAAWSPDALLATAAAACLMTSVLGRAAAEGIEVLGYVSKQRPTSRPAGAPPEVQICACITVGNDAVTGRVRALFEEALGRSPISRVLSARICVEVQVAVVGTDLRAPGVEDTR